MEPHTGVIIAAFAVAVVVLGGTVLAVMWDGRNQRRALARLSGRSSAGGEDAA